MFELLVLWIGNWINILVTSIMALPSGGCVYGAI